MKNIILICLMFVAWIGVQAQSSAPYFFPTTTSDTITNTEIDTITLSTRLLSNWAYGVTMEAANLSGTTSLILIVQESATSAGTDWYELGRDTLNGAGVTRITGQNVYGQRQRFIVDGEGTQSSTYTIIPTYKKD